MTSDDDLVQHAERAVVEAAVEWAREQKMSAPAVQTPAASKLRTACYMLYRARTITGRVRQDEIERAMAESVSTSIGVEQPLHLNEPCATISEKRRANR